MNDTVLTTRTASHADAPKSVPAAAAQEYPSTFDPDLIRWIPVYVPVLGLVMVLLTGAMWMVVG